MARNAQTAKVNEVAEKAAPARKAAPAKVTENIAAFEDATFSEATKLEFNFAKYDTVARIDEGLERLASLGATTQVLAHELTVASIRHYVTSGDYTKLASLFDGVKQAMGNSRVAALAKYIAAYVPTLNVGLIDPTSPGKGYRLSHIKGQRRRFVAEEQNMLDKPFWNAFEKEVPIIEFNFMEQLKKLLDRARSQNARISKAVNGVIMDDKGHVTARVSEKTKIPTDAEILQMADTFHIALEPAK